VQVETGTANEKDDCSSRRQLATADSSFVDSINRWVIALFLLLHTFTRL